MLPLPPPTAGGAGASSEDLRALSLSELYKKVSAQTRLLAGLLIETKKDYLKLCSTKIHSRIRSADAALDLFSSKEIEGEYNLLFASSLNKAIEDLVDEIARVQKAIAMKQVFSDFTPLTFNPPFTGTPEFKFSARIKFPYEKALKGYEGPEYLKATGQADKIVPTHCVHTTTQDIFDLLGITRYLNGDLEKRYSTPTSDCMTLLTCTHVDSRRHFPELNPQHTMSWDALTLPIFRFCPRPHDHSTPHPAPSLGTEKAESSSIALEEWPSPSREDLLKIMSPEDGYVPGNYAYLHNSPSIGGWPSPQFVIHQTRAILGPFTEGTPEHEAAFVAVMNKGKEGIETSTSAHCSTLFIFDDDDIPEPVRGLEHSLLYISPIKIAQTRLRRGGKEIILVAYSTLVFNVLMNYRCEFALMQIKRAGALYQERFSNLAQHSQQLKSIADHYDAKLPEAHASAAAAATHEKIETAALAALRAKEEALATVPPPSTKKSSSKRGGGAAAAAATVKEIDDDLSELTTKLPLEKAPELPNKGIILKSKKMYETFLDLLKGGDAERKRLNWTQAIQCLRALGFTVEPCGGSAFRFTFDHRTLVLSHLADDIAFIRKDRDGAMVAPAAGGAGGGPSAAAAASGGGSGSGGASIDETSDIHTTRTCHAPHGPGRDLERAPLTHDTFSRLRAILKGAGFHKNAVICER